MNETISASVELNERDPVKRVAGFIRRLVTRLSARGIAIGADVYQFPLTHTDIADATGLAPGEVNLALQKLQQNAILNIANDRITIIDAAKL
jgi:CRP-like cAMP-binding protein